QKMPVARSFIVEGEPLTGVTDGDDPGLEPAEARRPWRPGGARSRWRRVGRPQRLQAERVLDVRQQQLLMLLLVVQPELDRRRGGGRPLARQPAFHGRVDATAVVLNFGQRGPRELPAARPFEPRPHALVVRVEEKPVAFVDGAIAGREGPEQEG